MRTATGRGRGRGPPPLQIVPRGGAECGEQRGVAVCGVRLRKCVERPGAPVGRVRRAGRGPESGTLRGAGRGGSVGMIRA